MKHRSLLLVCLLAVLTLGIAAQAQTTALITPGLVFNLDGGHANSTFTIFNLQTGDQILAICPLDTTLTLLGRVCNFSLQEGDEIEEFSLVPPAPDSDWPNHWRVRSIRAGNLAISQGGGGGDDQDDPNAPPVEPPPPTVPPAVDDGRACRTDAICGAEYCSPECPCSSGQGHCDDDNDCLGDLVCTEVDPALSGCRGNQPEPFAVCL